MAKAKVKSKMKTLRLFKLTLDEDEFLRITALVGACIDGDVLYSALYEAADNAGLNPDEYSVSQEPSNSNALVLKRHWVW